VQQNLGLIARTIVQFEPVSMLVREQEYDIARNLAGPDVDLVVAKMDDLWMRDTGPVFVVDDVGGKAAVDFNFNGWGNEQEHQNDKNVASFIAALADTKLIQSSLILEGGGIELDGQGSAIITESCTLNGNRNPGVSKAQFEDILMPLLGLEKIIWLPGIKGKDITDGHTDFYARFAQPGHVIAGFDPDPASFDHTVTRNHIKILQSSLDASGRSLDVTVLSGPMEVRPKFDSMDFAAGYIGFFLCNDALIMQGFGDIHADTTAKRVLQQSFPNREIVQINIDGIAAGGGSVHCTTQQEPAV
jgi:agmatine deiminase